MTDVLKNDTEKNLVEMSVISFVFLFVFLALFTNCDAQKIEYRSSPNSDRRTNDFGNVPPTDQWNNA